LRAIEHVFELCPDGEEKVNADGVLVSGLDGTGLVGGSMLVSACRAGEAPLEQREGVDQFGRLVDAVSGGRR
jgi:hypothetical protein